MKLQLLFRLIILSILFSFTGCNKRTVSNDPIVDFKDVSLIKLNGSDIKLENDSVLYDPRSIHVFDSLAVFYDNNGYTAFSIININNGKLVKRFAVAGSGEYLFNINSVGINRVNDLSNEFTVYESCSPYRLFRYNMDSLVKVKNYHPQLICKIPKEVNFINPLMQSDSTIISNVSFSSLDNKVVARYNFYSDKITTGIELTKSPDKRFKEFYYKENIGWTKSILYSNLAFRPNSHQVASFSVNGAMYQVFSVINDSLKLVSEKLYYLPEFKILEVGKNVTKSKFTAKNRFGYNNIAVTDDYIYALFNGKLSEGNGSGSISTNTILVYDWNGTPVKKIILDKDCFQIAIDPKAPKILYTLTAFKNIGVRKFTLND